MERTLLGWCSCLSTCCWHAACCLSPWVRPAPANHLSTPVPSCVLQLSVSRLLILLLHKLPALDHIMLSMPVNVSAHLATLAAWFLGCFACCAELSWPLEAACLL